MLIILSRLFSLKLILFSKIDFVLRASNQKAKIELSYLYVSSLLYSRSSNLPLFIQKKFFLLRTNNGSDCFITENVDNFPLEINVSIT